MVSIELDGLVAYLLPNEPSSKTKAIKIEIQGDPLSPRVQVQYRLTERGKKSGGPIKQEISVDRIDRGQGWEDNFPKLDDVLRERTGCSFPNRERDKWLRKVYEHFTGMKGAASGKINQSIPLSRPSTPIPATKPQSQLSQLANGL
jgi:hypothetical protein